MNVLLITALVSGVNFFGAAPLYEEPLANVRSPDTGMTMNTSRYLGDRVYYLEATIGKNVPVSTLTLRDLSVQFSLQGGAWLILGYDDFAFPMLTQDFFFAFPLSFKLGQLSGAIKYNHISSHQGDGFDALMEEQLTKRERKEIEFYERIAKQNGVDILLSEPVSYSRDFGSLHLAYDYNVDRAKVRSYVHVGYVHKMIPDNLKRWFVGAGTEVIYPLRIASPYYAHDTTYNQDMDSLDYSGELGVVFLTQEDSLFEFRIALTGYVGSDRRGQLVGRKLKQFGFGFFIR